MTSAQEIIAGIRFLCPDTGDFSRSGLILCLLALFSVCYLNYFHTLFSWLQSKMGSDSFLVIICSIYAFDSQVSLYSNVS